MLFFFLNFFRQYATCFLRESGLRYEAVKKKFHFIQGGERIHASIVTGDSRRISREINTVSVGRTVGNDGSGGKHQSV